MQTLELKSVFSGWLGTNSPQPTGNPLNRRGLIISVAGAVMVVVAAAIVLSQLTAPTTVASVTDTEPAAYQPSQAIHARITQGYIQ